MKLNAVLAGMARLGTALAASGAVLLALPALAGDRALIDFIGFSADGRYFAFEEFGISDGAGFPYSSIYIVDLPNDRWLPGSPYRAEIEEEVSFEDYSADPAREQALAAAAPALARLAIRQPAQVLAMIGDGVPDTDGQRLDFARVGYFPGETADAYTLTMEMFPLDSSEPCEEYLGEKAKGFALTLSGTEAREVYRDASVPASRVCPLDYRIYAVVAPQFASDLSSAVAIVSVFPLGFEGPNRRFIAVPLGK